MFSAMCLLPGGLVVQSCWLRGVPSPASLSQGERFSEKSWIELCQVTAKAWNVIQQLSLYFDLPLTLCTWPRMLQGGQNLLILSCLKPMLSNQVYILIDASLCLSWSDFKQSKVNQLSWSLMTGLTGQSSPAGLAGVPTISYIDGKSEMTDWLTHGTNY